MNETTYVYIVHSDINENNIYAEFATEEEAIEYAKRHMDELTYVDRVEALVDEEGDIIEMFDSETIWAYDEEDEFSVEEDDDYWNQLAKEDEERKEDEGLLGDTTWFEDLDTDQLVETLEENEDIVECKECFELFPKADCVKIEVGYLCPHCHGAHCEDKECIEDEPIVLFDIADEDVFKVDFPEVERFSFSAENEMVPDEPTPEVENDPISEPECVGPECEAPVEAPVTKDETITKLVVDEHEAIDGYEKAKVEIEANSELDEKEKEEILDTIEHIKEEEVEHIEELEELVDEVEETEVETIDDSEEDTKSNILTEANWGGFIGIGKASVEDKLDAFFSLADDKKFKYNNNYGSNFELKEYNAKTKEFKDLSEADAKYINLIDNEYEKVRTAKKDAEKLSKSAGAKDKYIAVCIKDYNETDTPSIYIYQNGKLKADHSETKIKYFEAKYDRDNGNSNNSTQTSLEDTNYVFKPDRIEFELDNLQEKEISVFKGDNHISDDKLCKTFKLVCTKGIPIDIFKVKRVVNKYTLELIQEKLDKITDESVKEKLFAMEGFKLKLIIDGKPEAICTVIIKKKTPTEAPVEQPVEQPPVENNRPTLSEKLIKAYGTLATFLKKDEIKEYIIVVERKGNKITKCDLAEGKTFDDIKNKIKELLKNYELSESLTEHINEEHPAIESDQELVGTDNAVVDCKVADVVTHSEDEKPVDCEGKKKPLEKPLTEDLLEVNVLERIRQEAERTGYASWVCGGSGYIANCIEIVYENGVYTASYYTSTESGHGDTDPEDIIESEDFREVIKVLVDEGWFNPEDDHYQEITAEEAHEYLTRTEKSLTESLDEDKLQTMEKYLKSKKWASLEDSWTEEGESYVNEMGAYLDYNHMTNQFVLAISIYHASDDNNADDPDRHTEEEEYGFDSLNKMYEDEYCADCLDRIYDANEHKLYIFLTEATHAQVAKPEGSRTLAYNNALTYAKKANKPYIFGYTNHTGKFFALDLPLKVTGNPGEAEKEFRSKYKNSKVVYIAYPDKDFITESKFTKAEQEEYNMDEDGISLDSYDEFVRCGWCGEIFTKDSCVFEKDFGWLCDRCQDELRYHGGHLDIIVDPTEEDIERAKLNESEGESNIKITTIGIDLIQERFRKIIAYVEKATNIDIDLSIITSDSIGDRFYNDHRFDAAEFTFDFYSKLDDSLPETRVKIEEAKNLLIKKLNSMFKHYHYNLAIYSEPDYNTVIVARTEEEAQLLRYSM